jgi:hypothetical protein
MHTMFRFPQIDLLIIAPSHHRKPRFRRKHHHHPLVQRELHQFGLSASEWQYRRACYKADLLGFEPDEPMSPLGFSFDRSLADENVSKLDHLYHYHQYSILHGSQFLSTARNQQVIDQSIGSRSRPQSNLQSHRSVMVPEGLDLSTCSSFC